LYFVELQKEKVDKLSATGILIALGLTIFAGLSTGIGGLIVLLFKKPNPKALSVSLGLSAGVMVYISFVELLSESNKQLVADYGTSTGGWLSLAAFFGGIFLIAIIDKLIPVQENPHEYSGSEGLDYSGLKGDQKLFRVGVFTALIIAIHNFPEGMATFISAIQDPSLGIAVAIAVAIHNVPEGISVAIPVYSATGSRMKALGWSIISGLGEPLGAVIAYLIIMPILSDALFGILYAVIAGIMVYISFDELLPTAREYGEHHLTIYGLIAGMMIMAVSLQLLM
jgi:ZIP family zinc transporter